jgi:hypothetical protein
VREGLEQEDPSNYLELLSVLAKLTRRYNEERLHSALGYLPPWEFYRGDPSQRFEERRVKAMADRRGRESRPVPLRSPAVACASARSRRRSNLARPCPRPSGPTQLARILSGIDLRSAQQRKRYQRPAPEAEKSIGAPL